jgi:DNA modification methylase
LEKKLFEKDVIICGNALQELKKFPDECIDCVVTSPPYWNLRDYGTASWEGGDPNCDHIKTEIRTRINLAEWSAKNARGGAHAVPEKIQFGDFCEKCGAIRIDNQIGLERTPDEYVASLVAVFREAWRVMKPHSTLWLNLGDSYATQPAGNTTWSDGVGSNKHYQNEKIHQTTRKNWGDLKPKDLVGIPWRVAFALQADGWYLRSDIIWNKTNPMPESVKDRPTKAHEYIFLLAKNSKYYYDYDSILEIATGYDGRKDTRYKGGKKDMAGGAHERWNYKNLQNDGQQPNTMHLKRLQGEEYMSPVRNKRSVWTVSTKPYKGAHFATFPEKLIEPCILAGCPKDGIVLDPFMGSGTVGLVSKKLGRHYIGIELNSVYIELANERINTIKA